MTKHRGGHQPKVGQRTEAHQRQNSHTGLDPAKLQESLRKREAQQRQEREAARQNNIRAHEDLLKNLSSDTYNQLDALEPLRLLPDKKDMPFTENGETLLSYALKEGDAKLFSLAVNQKNYPLHLPLFGEQNPLSYLCTIKNGTDFLNLVKTKITHEETDFLTSKLLSQFPHLPAQIIILTWLVENNLLSTRHSQKLNALAVHYCDHYPHFTNIVFSSSLGIFPQQPLQIRQQCLQVFFKHYRNTSICLLEWYCTGDEHHRTFYFESLENDLASTFPQATYALNSILELALQKQVRFASISVFTLQKFINFHQTSTALPLNHLIHQQPQIIVQHFSQLTLNEQLYLTQIAAPIIPQRAYEKTFSLCDRQWMQTVGERTYQQIDLNMKRYVEKSGGSLITPTRQINREKISLSFIKNYFEKEIDENKILEFALRLEREWTNDERFSCRSIEVLLKLAKTSILNILKQQEKQPDHSILNFMAKHRKSYYVLGCRFQLTMFSTQSSQICHKLQNHHSIEQELARERLKGEQEFNALLNRRY